MNCVAKPLRYAHSEGHLDICFDEEGEHIITCGPDGDVRIFEGFEDDDPLSHRVGEIVYAVIYKNHRFYTASDDNSVQASIFKDGQPDGLVTRSTAPITHIVFNKLGNKFVTGSCDFTVKLKELEGSFEQVFEGHEAPILSIALHPKDNLLASSSCDGTVRVWNVEDKKCIKVISGLPKTNDFLSSITLCRLKWSLDGKQLFIPIDKEVRVYDTETWEIKFTLTHDSLKEVVSVLSVSPCGQFIAGAARDGVMCIWQISTKRCMLSKKHENGHTITGLAWNPKSSNEIAYCDNNGYLGLLDLELKEDSNNPKAKVADPLADLFDDDDDILVEATNPANAFIDDVAEEDAEDDDDDDLVTLFEKKKSRLRIDDDSRDTDTDAGIPDVVPDGEDSNLTGISVPVLPAAPTVRGYEPTPLQRPFQSSSTPTHMSHRFMVWNSIGLIQQYNTEEETSINVEFHDTATHHALHIVNNLGHTMADLSSEAVLLACESDEDHASKLVCMHFGSWDNNKEWNVCLPDGEEIQTLCLGEGWLAVGTDKRRVRLFTVGGVQKEIISIPGPIVTMSAHSNQLAIVYHKAAGLPGDQCLGLLLLHVSGTKHRPICAGDALPLSPRSTLVFMGFSAEGTPFIADSSGILRMMRRNFGHTWTEVANLKKHCKGKSDNYWIVGLHENPQQLRAILCKGSKYPPTLPRPMVQILDFELPFADRDCELTNMEENYWRASVFSHHLEWWDSQGYEVEDTAKHQAMLPQQESLMKQFALACKMEREFRAVELCEMMPSHTTVQLAIKYASRLRLMQLAGRLNQVARSKVEAEMHAASRRGLQEEEEEEEEEEQAPPISMKRAVPNVAVPRCAADPRTEEGEEEEGDTSMDIYEEIEEEEEAETAGPILNLKPKTKESSTPKTLLNSQTAKKNPFKLASHTTPTNTVTKGTSVFDSMEKAKQKSNPFKLSEPTAASKKKTNVKKNVSTKGKLFSSQKINTAVEKPPEQPKKSAFQLWMDSHKEEVRSEHPEMSEEDLAMTAIKTFKQLPKEEQQEWKRLADGDTKKRKREDEQENDETKMKKIDTDATNKDVSQTTTSKLKGFAFGKS